MTFNVQQEVVALQKLRHVFSHAAGLEQVRETARNWKHSSRHYAPKDGIDLSQGYVGMSAEFVRGRFDVMRPVFSHIVSRGRDKLEQLGVSDPLTDFGPTDSRPLGLWEQLLLALRRKIGL